MQANPRVSIDGLTAQQTVLLVVFTLSGFTGLIYESIWSHYLKLFLGHAAYAQTLVLAIFMGGMALGAWLIGRRSERLPRLLLTYAAVELVIGICGLLFHGFFVRFLEWSFTEVIPSLATSGSVQAFKWAAASGLILPQAVLLGMTFPLISGGVIRSAPHRSGEFLALLYFTNCLGASAGVLFSGFFLIDRVGLPGTLLTAGILNVLLALTVWPLGRAEGVAAPDGDKRRRSPGSSQAVSWLWTAALVTGVASFLYEIAWIRMLSLVLGSSTHSFELMLAAFIFGLAIGGLWVRRRIDRLADPARFLSLILLAMGVLAALTLPGYNLTFTIIAWAKSAFAPTAAGYAGYTVLAQTVAAGLMVPVTFFAGMTLPLITHLLLRRTGDEGAIGGVYALNTLGAIAGVVASTHVLLPAIGTKGTIVAGAALQIALAAAGLLLAGRGWATLRAQLPIAAAALAVAVIAWTVQLDPRRMTSAVYRTGLAESPAGSEVLYLRDGKTSTISLVRNEDTVVIATNGKPDAAIAMGGSRPAPDESTMIIAAALPLALHPAPRTVANIGIGSGLTSQVLLSTNAVASLTSIEIEPFMVDAARQGFMPRVARLFDDPRSRIVIEDAKTFFAGAGTTFDVIVSEPSNPWVSGVATLFSDEFYRHLVRYLAPDGLLVQWLQIYETDIRIVASILKALSPHFSDYHVYNVDDANMLVVASRGGTLGDPDPRIFDSESLREELRRAGVVDVEDLTSRRIGNKQLLDAFMQTVPVPVNSDYFPYVDQNAMMFRFMNRNAIQLPGLTMLPVPFLELALPAWRTRSPAAAAEFGVGHRESLANRAGLMAASIASGNSRYLPDEIQASVAALSPVQGACTEEVQKGAWRAATRALSMQTSAMLPYEDLAPLWRKVTTSPCYATAAADDLAQADFLHAVARRDRSEIARLGTMLLERSSDAATRQDFGYVLTATTAALFGLGEHDAVVRTIGRWGAGRPLPEETALAIQVLAAAAAGGT